eukprot:TRINITY_DN6309_c0_g1_i2.p1 TRINITY_DN6309_c0_g1~~TRINITY_DN6309_c0_g1_i2.p1  ORF type:complete len:134 (-),score=22.76 TRINITY_DN6309_c0_g1_i2:31-432(-)
MLELETENGVLKRQMRDDDERQRRMAGAPLEERYSRMVDDLSRKLTAATEHARKLEERNLDLRVQLANRTAEVGRIVRWTSRGSATPPAPHTAAVAVAPPRTSVTPPASTPLRHARRLSVGPVPMSKWCDGLL